MKSDMDLAIETAQLHLDVLQVERDMVAIRIAALPVDAMERIVCERRLERLDEMVVDAESALAEAKRLQFRAAFVLPRKVLQARLRGRHVPRKRA